MSVAIAALQVEHHESGFAIGVPSPRLSWRFAATTIKDWRQKSYEIIITRNGKDESYKVESEQSILVPWPSKPLTSRERVIVKARVKGTDGSESDWSTLNVEAALLDPQEWKANLIASSEKVNLDEPKKPFRLRKTFELSSTSSARLYTTAHGLYEVEINGQRVGDQVLAPGWQTYDKHLNYQTYDVSSLLKTGTNVIGAYVGEGWFAGRLGRPGMRNIWGDRIGWLGQLEVDGKVAVVSNDTWEYLDGPVTAGEIYNGETSDSRLEDPTWSTTSTNSKSLGKAEILPFPTAKLISSDAPPVRRISEIKPIEIISTPGGKTVLDFGQNLVGWVRIEKDLGGKAGTEVVIRTAEVLERGELGTRPLRTAKSTDTIILGGKTKGWEPKFTFHGFRYIEVSGLEHVDLSDFTAVVISSDMRRTGTFDSSHEMINRLHKNVVWSMMGNFVSVPTDCPQRDERMGWTGDLQVFAPTANYLYDTSGLLTGWMADVVAEQNKYNGVPPVTIPFVTKFVGHQPHPHAIWADLVALTPWDLYTAFGDRTILENHFQSMVDWLEKGVPRGPDGFYDQNVVQYGDWLDPKAPPSYPANGASDTHLCANAYLVYVTEITARVAKIIGKASEAKHWGSEHAKLRKRFQEEYVTPNGRLMSDTQTALALALKFNLLDNRERAIDRLQFVTRWEGFRITTGFAGTPIMADTLAENGHLNLAYRILQEKSNPSWLYPVSMGATTIWERWDSMLPDGTINPGQMTSFNHYALGAVANFLHTVVGGLSPLEPGWKRALIRPQPGGTITSASTSFDSPYGLYSVKWNIEGKKLKVDIVVPPNTEAEVVLPGVKEVVGSGSKSYEVDFEAEKNWPPEILRGPQGLQMPDEFAA